MIGALNGDDLRALVWDKDKFRAEICSNVLDKMRRTVRNQERAPFSDEDLRENLITGFASGVYMYFRSVYNDIHLGRVRDAGREFVSTNFYFVREYCYGSMFRYNSRGEFNIPYGGMSYNRKDFASKVDEIFAPETELLFKGAEISCRDFEEVLEEAEVTEEDFIFLDPPYDSDFSDYEGRKFGKEDHIRLRDALVRTKAKFILIIRNTDFIFSLYENRFNILCFDKTYTYNVRSRNERNAEHLIVTNLDI